MTDVLSRALPAPDDWQAFERLCFDLYSLLWETNDIEMHGRRGQPQAGVDIYGTDRREGKFVGVQCKGKEEGYGTKLSKRELLREVKKAKTFSPRLEIFIIATTVPNDSVIQELARDISVEHAQQGLFEVRVQGWTTLKQHITSNTPLLIKHFRDLAPFDVVGHIDTSTAVMVRSAESIRLEVAQLREEMRARVTETAEPGDPLQLRINEAIKLVEDGSLSAALRAFERLWREEASGASSRNRYRLRANIAQVNLLLGARDVAIKGFRAAFSEDPEWPPAKAILATAYVLEGSLTQAFDLAQTILAEDPSVRTAAVVIIDAAPRSYSAAEVAELIPPGLRDHFDLLLGLAGRARNVRDYAGAECYARRAIEASPGDWRAIATLAEAHFAPIADIEAVRFTRNVPLELQPRLDSAIQLLRQAWSLLLSRDDTIRGAHVAANLISCLDVAGLIGEAALVLQQSLRIAPTYSPLLRQYAREMFDAGEWNATEQAIRKIPAPELEASDRFLLLQALIRMGRAEQARSEARELQQESTDEPVREMAAAVRLDASARLGTLEEELDELLSAWPTSVYLRSIAIGLFPPEHPRTAALAAELDQLAAGVTDIRARFHAAEALYRVKAFSRAADLYEGLHGTDNDSPALDQHLRALYFADRRGDARKLFDSLADDVRLLPDYAQIGVAIYVRSGLLANARELLEHQLSNSEILSERLKWFSLVERLGDSPAITRWLTSVPADQQGKPGDLMLLALAIDKFCGDSRSLPIAYRGLRSGFGDPQIHLQYSIGLFLNGRVGSGLVNAPEVVANDTAVTLVELDSGKRFTRIIETEPDARVEREEIAPSHDFARRLIGLRRGDEIDVDSVGILPTRYVVADIQDKYLFAHFRSLNQFEKMFPGNRAFGTFDVSGTNPEKDFKPILDSVKARHDYTERLFEMYRSGSMPLALVARFAGSSPMSVWESVRNHPNLDFFAAFGVPVEFEEAKRSLQANRRGIVDPVTLYGLVQLGIAGHVRSVFSDLALVQSTLDLLRDFLEEQMRMQGTNSGSLGWNGRNYVMVELSDEDVQERISKAEAAFNFAKSLTLVPAESRVPVNDKAKELFDGLQPAFRDSILAAQGDTRIFLCDDRSLRAIANVTLGASTVWTQAAARFGVEFNLIPLSSLLEVTGALADAGYFFTTVSIWDFLRELGNTVWTISPRLRRLIELLARPTNDPDSVNKVTSRLAVEMWRLKPSMNAFIDVFSHIFATVRLLQPGVAILDFAQQLCAEVHMLLRGLVRAKQFKDTILGATSLSPCGMTDVMLELRYAFERQRAETIAFALSEAAMQSGAAPSVSSMRDSDDIVIEPDAFGSI